MIATAPEPRRSRMATVRGRRFLCPPVRVFSAGPREQQRVSGRKTRLPPPPFPTLWSGPTPSRHRRSATGFGNGHYEKLRENNRYYSPKHTNEARNTRTFIAAKIAEIVGSVEWQWAGRKEKRGELCTGQQNSALTTVPQPLDVARSQASQAAGASSTLLLPSPVPSFQFARTSFYLLLSPLLSRR